MNREEFVRAVAAVDSFSRSGVPVIVDDDFEPCDEPGRLSKSARQAPAAVEAHLYKQRVLGMGILLTEAALQSIVDRNEMTNGIALQKEKLRGRLTTNCSGNAARRGKFLNSKGAKKKAIAEWGELKLPTIELIILDIIEIADEHGQDEVVALKADVDTAYPQCSFDPKKVQWMTFGFGVLLTALQFWMGTDGVCVQHDIYRGCLGGDSDCFWVGAHVCGRSDYDYY